MAIPGFVRGGEVGHTDGEEDAREGAEAVALFGWVRDAEVLREAAGLLVEAFDGGQRLRAADVPHAPHGFQWLWSPEEDVFLQAWEYILYISDVAAT